MVFLQGVGVSTCSPCGSTRSTRTPHRSCSTSRTGWPATCGASASRPPTPSPRPSASPTTARSGSRRACSTPCRRPPTTATATSRSPTYHRCRQDPGGRPGLIGPCLDELVAARASSANRCRRRGAAIRPGGLPGALPPGRAVPWPPACWACCTPGRAAARLPGVDWARRWAGCTTGPAGPGPRAGAGGPARPHQKVAVLTGGPGCGKSFTVRSIVELARPRRPAWCWSRPPAGPPNGWPS